MAGAAQSRTAKKQQWLARIDSALRSQGLDAAASLALQALAEGVEHPAVLNLAAAAHYGAGRFDEAATLLRRARALAPKDAQILNSLGICLQALGKNDAALEAYTAANRADPGLAAAHFNRGTLLEQLLDLKGAKAAYERAAELDRNYLEPVAGLAWLSAQSGDPAAARLYGERVASRMPANALAGMALAQADLQDCNFADAAERLARLNRDPTLTPVNGSITYGLIGDLHDAEGRPAEAFAAYAACNDILRQVHAAEFVGQGRITALGQVQQLTEWFAGSEPAAWQEAPPARPRASDPKAHVFLVGFPRSGTTLLENVLAAHPEVVALEEKDCLADAADAFLRTAEGLSRLARIGAAEAARYRDAYWAKVRRFGVEPRGRVFIDKQPLSSVLLPVVAKFFPNALILFARRDPRDVVLSCFRRRFGMNPAMYQLLTLEGGADYYDAVMRLSALYRERLPLPQHIVRYESLVDDFEATAQAGCAFLGVEWDPGLLDFAAKARERSISTPSAAQVVRGINRDGQGVWRRYQRQLAPVLPLLEPWIREFGYD